MEVPLELPFWICDDLFTPTSIDLFDICRVDEAGSCMSIKASTLLPKLSRYQISVLALASFHTKLSNFARFHVMPDSSNAAEKSKARQPSWSRPVSKAPEPVLRVYNS